MRTVSIFSFIILLSLCACNKSNEPRIDRQLTGKWQYAERGYYTGDRYITEQISTSTQILELRSDSTVMTTVEELKGYKFFTAKLDVNGNPILTLFKDNTHVTFPNEGLAYRYSIDETGTVLRLEYRLCFEPCHMGFKRI